MIQTLEQFEDMFPDIDSTKQGHIFKGGIRNAFNDVIRAQRDELLDYEVDFRPLRMTNDNVLAMTQTFMQTVQHVEMDIYADVPRLRIYGDKNRAKVLDSVRLEFGTGVIYQEDDRLVLEIVGTQSCVDCVLSIMDRYRLHANVHGKYQEWRSEVVRLYRS